MLKKKNNNNEKNPEQRLIKKYFPQHRFRPKVSVNIKKDPAKTMIYFSLKRP